MCCLRFHALSFTGFSESAEPLVNVFVIQAAFKDRSCSPACTRRRLLRARAPFAAARTRRRILAPTLPQIALAPAAMHVQIVVPVTHLRLSLPRFRIFIGSSTNAL